MHQRTDGGSVSYRSGVFHDKVAIGDPGDVKDRDSTAARIIPLRVAIASHLHHFPGAYKYSASNRNRALV